MPRTVANDNEGRRSVVLSPCRVTKTERAQIKTKAAAAGMSVSEYQRRALLDGVVIVREAAADARLIRELNAVGVNLNQLARAANIDGRADMIRLRDALAQLSQIMEALAS